jgi:hypothetical protein
MWREIAHEALLDSVLQDLASAGADVDTSASVYDELSEALRELYITQARLFGVPVDAYTAALTPADVLRLIIETYAARPGVGATTDSAPLTHEFEAIDYLARNDLERTVLLQRLWVRTLAAGMEQEQPKEGEDVRRLVAALEQADAQATNLFVQLYEGHRTVLQMWLLVL